MQKSDRTLDFIFDRMRELLQGGWQQGCMAKDKEGMPCFPEAAEATSFDLYGAFERVFVVHSNMRPLKGKALLALMKPLGEPVMLNWEVILNKFNDTPGRTREEILLLVERAKNA